MSCCGSAVIQAQLGRLRLLVALCGLLLAPFGVRPAAAAETGSHTAASSRHFAAGTAAFARGELAAALVEFEAALAAGGDDGATHYNIGVCAYKLGDYRRAEAEFRVLRRRFPEMRVLADYNLGLSLMRQQRRAEAREAFEAAREGGDEKIAALASTALARLGESSAADAAARSAVSSGSREWLKLLDIGIGHDGNVALIDEASLPLGQTSESAYAEAFGYLSGPVGHAASWRLDLSAYLVTYTDVSGFDQVAARAAGVREWRLSRWHVDAGPHYARTTLDGESLEEHLGVSIDARYALGADRAIGLRLVHDEIDALGAQYDYLTGRRDQLRFVYEHGVLRLGYELERNDRRGAGVSPERARYVAKADLPLRTPWSADFEYEFRASDYDGLAVPRSEERHELAFSVRRDFRADWELEAQLLYADNESSDPFYTYTRWRVAAGISKAF